MTKLIPQIRDLEYPERLRILKLPSIAYRRSRGDMIEVYKLLTVKFSTNDGLLKNNRHSSTRGHHLKLEKQQFRLQIRRHSFPIRVLNLWNSLPKHVVLAPTLLKIDWTDTGGVFNIIWTNPRTRTHIRKIQTSL